jgi:hypothetical protein
MKQKLLFLATLFAIAFVANAQTLFVPNGSTGIGSSVNGNVGIGTTSLAYKLVIQGNSAGANAGTLSLITLSANSGEISSLSLAGTFVNNSDKGTRKVADIIGGFASGAWGTEYLSFNVGNNGSANDTWNVTSEKMRILNNGNVGIGTTSPAYQLDVTGTGRFSSGLYVGSNLRIADESTHTILSCLGAGNAFVFYGNLQWQGINAGNVMANGNITTTGSLQIGSNTNIHDENNHSIISCLGSDNFVSFYGNSQWQGINAGNITANGNITTGALTGTTANFSGSVGIGTTHPAYSLDVLGIIHAKEVLVDLNGVPDFVFDKDYKLPSIEHVASYVQENKHLPDIPSAKEIEKNGVSLNEMQVKLLQKVEELTLYVIELKKENEQMNNRIKELETK